MGDNRNQLYKNITASQAMALLRPAALELADVHARGEIYGNISPESIMVSDIRFCFPLSEKAARTYDTDQKVFIRLLPPEKDRKEKAGADSPGGSGSGAGRRDAYIPLEQLIAGGRPDSRSDVYSLCAVFYQIITGTEPPAPQSRISGAELKSPSELGIEIPPSQEAALMKGLAEMSRDRYVDGGELYRALYGGTEERKKNFLRDGWKIEDDVDEIEKLRTVTFLDYIPRTEEEKWDVSENEDGSVMAWMEKGDEGYNLYVGSDGVIMAGEYCNWMFSGCKSLTSVDFGKNFNTSQVTDMSFMFVQCGSLKELDLSGFDTSQVTDMNSMFDGCRSLVKLDVSSFDTSQVTDMCYMFARCGSLEKLDVSCFDTSRVENMDFMFDRCESLVKLDVGGFDTSRVTGMSYMFAHCSSLEELDLSSFDMSKLKSREGMLTGTRWG